MSGVHRWRWIAAAAAAAAVVGMLVLGGLPAGAEAWADRRVAGCGSVAQRHAAPIRSTTPPAATPPAATQPTETQPTETQPTETRPTATRPTATRPRDPADWRMGTFRAAGCQAWLRLHRHRGPNAP